MAEILYQPVFRALYATLARNLHGAPAADELPIIAEVMAADLRIFGYNEQHTDMVEASINQFARTHDDWPTVRQVREEMQDAARQRRMNQPQLPAPPPGAEMLTHLGDYLPDARADVAAFRKEHGDNWRQEYSARIRQQAAEATRARLKSAKDEHAKKQAIREQFQKTEMTEIVNDVFTTMPAPWDQEGIKRYNQKLQEVQEFIPDHE